MSAAASQWVWSPQHLQHYRWVYDASGNPHCEWAPAVTQDASAPRALTTQNWAPRSLHGVSTEDAEEEEEEEDESSEEDEEEEEDDDDGAEVAGQPQQQLAQPQTAYTYAQQTGAATNPYSYSATSNQYAGYAGFYNSTLPPSSTAHYGASWAGASSPVTAQQHHANAAYPSNQPYLAPQPATLHLERRRIRTGNDRQDTETLDPRYKRVRPRDQARFFCPGRAFMMLWTEPAGQLAPGRTRGSTHFSVVRFRETVYSEIRRFVVVQSREQYSQCIPIQTYGGQATLKPGLRADDHALIYSGDAEDEPPELLEGEELSKLPLRVRPSNGEYLGECSRINFGKTYTVEHNVKVLNIGKVCDEHLVLLDTYWKNAILGQYPNVLT